MLVSKSPYFILQEGSECHRLNVQADSSSDYYWLNPTIPLLNHLISELNVCFDATTSRNVMEFMYWLPSAIVESATLSGQDSQTYWNSTMTIFHLRCHLIPSWTSGNTSGHLSLKWPLSWTPLRKPCLTLTVTSSLTFVSLSYHGHPSCDHCEFEQSISMLKVIKSPLRSSMGQDRLVRLGNVV